MLKKIQTKKKGAVLLIAILVASVALAVGFGVYNRTYKELLFASFWKQTQVAFSAADSGIECAMYWDLHPGASPRKCFEVDITGWTPGFATSPSGVNMNTGTGCVNIIIIKNGGYPFTTIQARGYNDACGSTNPRRVERALKVDY